MAFLIRDQDTILNQSLDKLAKNTNLTAISPGSVIRSIAEVMTQELGDFYRILDFNVDQSFISSAKGRSLDLIGALYNTPRKKLTETASIDAQTGTFYFYIDNPYPTDIEIPSGTRVYTNTNNDQGPLLTYLTDGAVTLRAGRTRVFTSIRPIDAESVMAAGANTLVLNDFNEAAANIATEVRCINPKAVPSVIGYEADDAYRTRIIKAVRTSAGGTFEALRFAALALDGIRDITVRTAPFGLGTVEILVVPEENIRGTVLLQQVTEVMERVRPVGVRMWIKLPEYMALESTMTLFIAPGTPSTEYNNIVRRAEVSVIRFINRLLVSTPLIYNQLVQAVYDASEFITDVSFSNLSVGGQQILRRNYTPPDDTQLIPGAIRASIAS